MISIFLSRPNPFLNSQSFFSEKLSQLLSTNNISHITLSAKNYNPYESLTYLNEMIRRCYGMIIVAFGQTYVEKGISKKGAMHNDLFYNSEEKNIENLWITSPFCHIEGAIAFSNNIPLLIMEQKNIKIEGILEMGTHAIICPPFSLTSEENIEAYFSSNDLKKSFCKWINQVENLYNKLQNSSI